MAKKKSKKQAQSSSEGYREALALLHSCRGEYGFLATTQRHDNYNRVWGRDSCIAGLAALLTNDDELIEGCRLSLETLAKYQGPHGEIPSNVDPETERVSLGGTAGRVDADLWFVITCCEYWKRTENDDFMDGMLEALEKVRHLLGAWEFNNRGLIYVPPTGDWADEYMQSGYVLYDQLLYLQAQRAFGEIHRHKHGGCDHALDEKTARLEHLIRANYWFAEACKTPADIYHEVLFKKGCEAAPRRNGQYWMPFFSPVGYGYRFDSMANALVMLFEVADDDQCEAVDDYIAQHIVPDKLKLLPAFSPVITPKDEGWDDLQMTFSHTFKNKPHEYHNGGLWPMVTGFYAASLAQRGHKKAAKAYTEGIHQANLADNDDKEAHPFPEFLHGKKLKPSGTSQMAWSAAGGIIAESYLNGKRLFNQDHDDKGRSRKS
ncbi:MAG TPA: glycoside hydrolase 100 family protein [Opitutales bacterium]|nr:glycoside hydrolase 100 family protein [Opitutales bacterium]